MRLIRPPFGSLGSVWSVLLLVLLLTGSLRAEDPSPDTNNPGADKPLVPFALGNSWTYDGLRIDPETKESKSFEITNKVLGRMLFDDKTGKPQEWFFYTEFGWHFFGRIDEQGYWDGLVDWPKEEGFDDEEPDLTQGETFDQPPTFDRSILYLKYPTEAGNTWTAVYPDEDPEWTTVFEFRTVAVDRKVKTPAGTFRCVVYTAKTRGEDNTFEYAIAPGVGIVSYIDRNPDEVLQYTLNSYAFPKPKESTSGKPLVPYELGLTRTYTATGPDNDGNSQTFEHTARVIGEFLFLDESGTDQTWFYERGFEGYFFSRNSEWGVLDGFVEWPDPESEIEEFEGENGEDFEEVDITQGELWDDPPKLTGSEIWWKSPTDVGDRWVYRYRSEEPEKTDSEQVGPSEDTRENQFEEREEPPPEDGDGITEGDETPQEELPEDDSPTRLQTMSVDRKVTVPAGTFRCIDYAARWDGGVEHSFIAPGVGVIKHTIRDERGLFVYELKSHNLRRHESVEPKE